MRKRFAAIVFGAGLFATPAFASHLLNLGDPYPTRGACESATTELDNFDRDGLLGRFPELFSTRGDTRAFITGAFTCEQSDDDDMWYIADHLQERLDSGWFGRRQR